MRLLTLIGLAALLPTLVAAQPASTTDFAVPVIIATGSAQVERPADWHDFSAGINATGATAVEALRTLKERQDAVERGLRALTGVRRVQLETRAGSVSQTWSAECQRRYTDDQDRAASGECRPTGYAAAATTDVRIWPAERAGAAMALAAERGANQVRLDETGVDAPEALRRAALEAAVRDARSQAEAAARGGGATLGPLLRVVDPEARTTVGGVDYLEGVAMTGTRIRAAVEINVAPRPVRQSARVTAVFQLER